MSIEGLHLIYDFYFTLGGWFLAFLALGLAGTTCGWAEKSSKYNIFHIPALLAKWLVLGLLAANIICSVGVLLYRSPKLQGATPHDGLCDYGGERATWAFVRIPSMVIVEGKPYTEFEYGYTRLFDEEVGQQHAIIEFDDKHAWMAYIERGKMTSTIIPLLHAITSAALLALFVALPSSKSG